MRSIRSFESQRLQRQQANQWADQAQRDKISLYGDLETKKKSLPRKSSKRLKNSEEFVAKKQTEQDKQELMNCLCIKRNSTTLSRLLTQIQELPNNVNSDQGAGPERPTFPVKPPLFGVPEPCRALDCRV